MTFGTTLVKSLCYVTGALCVDICHLQKVVEYLFCAHRPRRLDQFPCREILDFRELLASSGSFVFNTRINGLLTDKNHFTI